MFNITICDPETGTPLCMDGKWPSLGKNPLKLYASTHEEAIKVKEQLLKDYFPVEVYILNTNSQEFQVFQSDDLSEYYEEKSRYRKWETTFFLKKFFTPSPECSIYDPQKDNSNFSHRRD